MDSDHKFAWTRKWVVINTLGTLASAVTGLAAVTVAAVALVIALTS